MDIKSAGSSGPVNELQGKLSAMSEVSSESNWRYLGNYADAMSAISSGQYLNVENYHQKIGQKQNYVLAKPDKLFLESIDVNWVNRKYKLLPFESSPEQIIEAYMLGVKDHRYCPNENFDEESYVETYADVKAGVFAGDYLCGFEHYIVVGSTEARSIQSVVGKERTRAYEKMMELEKRIPGVTVPLGLDQIDNIKRFYYRTFNSELGAGHERRLLVLIPHLDPGILFGGYTAFFEFIKELQNRGVKTHFAVCEPVAYANPWEMLAALKEESLEIYDIVTRFSSPTICSMGAQLEVGQHDQLIAYSSVTARIAQNLVKKYKLKNFYFFIQEFEALFHTSNSNYFVCAEPFYYENYRAIFNSDFLKAYFINNGIGNTSVSAGDCLTFEHAIKKVPIDRKLVQSRKRRNFIFYARPESHAQRNLFEICVYAIERAIVEGAFEGDWSFTGVGTLGTYADIDMPFGHVLKVIPKLPGGDYYRALQTYDAGMSLILTPHPGVVHFEFARAGIPTVTNTYSNRNAKELQQISGNIFPAIPTSADLVRALTAAANMSSNIDARIENANAMTAPSTWKEAYACVADEVAAGMR